MKNTFVKVLSFMMALTMIVGAFGAITVSAAECAHTPGEKGEKVDPTCVKPGFTWYTCATCGEQYMDDVVPATGKHTEVVDPATDATCTEPAKTAGTKCSVCKAVITAKKDVEGSEPLGHDFVIKETAATCTSANQSYYECTRCNKTATKASDDEKLEGDDRYDKKYPTITYGAALKHDWDYKVIAAPTICTDGKVTVTCKNCKTVKNVDVPAVHQYVAITDTSSCAKYESGEQCELCGKIKDGAVENDDVAHSWVDVTVMNASVEALGIKSASELSVDAKCGVAGYKVQRCSNCNLYAKNPVPALDHVMVWGSVVGGEMNKDASACVTAQTKTATCTRGCGHKETITVKAATAHVLKTTEVKPTCTTDGYTKVECTVEGCNYEVISNYKDANGHTWGAWTYTGDCSTGITATRECTVEGCTADPETETTLPGQHNMTTGSVVKVVAATCQNKAYYVYYCQNANCRHTEKVANSDFGSVDTTNHQNLTLSFTKTAATCTTTGIDVYLCACGATVEKTTDTIAHTKGLQYKVGNTVKVDVNAVPVNCQTDGKTEGEVCTKCGKILKPQEVISKATLDLSKPASHKDTTPAPHGDPVPATCISDGYQLAYFDCCGYVQINIVKASAEKHTMSNVPYLAPTCTTTGTHAYYGCTVKGCGYIANVSTAGCKDCGKDHDVVVATLDATIAALGHKLKNVKAVNETCTDNGTTAHKQCERCAYTEGKRVIPAHGDKYKTASNAVPATCTTKGKVAVTAGTLCQVCDVAKIETKALGHDYVATPVNADDCTKPTYTVHECARGCGSYYADNFAPGKEAHNYELNWHKVENKDGYIYIDGVATSDYACQIGTYEYRQCVNCTNVVKQNEQAPIAHYYLVDGSTKVEIKLTCKNIAEFDGHTCALCGHKVVADANKAGVGDLTIAHNYKTTTKAPTCTEAGYTIVACATCGDVKENTPHNATKHAVKYVIEEKAATNSADGYKKFMCSKCNVEVTEVLPKLATAPVMTYTASTDKVAAGEKFTVTLALSVVSETFVSKDIDVPYDASKLTLVGVTANADLAGLNAFAATKIVDNSGVKVPYVGVSLVVANDAEGNAQKVTTAVEGTVLFTLEFQVNKTASGDATVAGKTVKIAGVGNLNGDTIVTAADAQAIFAQIGTENTAADVNNDGIVNLADVAALATFAASGKTAKDYLVMAGEYDAIEAEVYALLDAGRLANHDTVTSVINVNDALALIAKIDAALVGGYATLGDNVTAAAVVAYYNAQ